MGGQIELYEIQQIKTIKLLQTFPKEHSSSNCTITSLLQINPNTLVSSASASSSNPDDNVIVIWSKSKSSLLYEPLQRMTREETGGTINSLVLINQKKEEEAFASCCYWGGSIIIWRRGKGDKEMFKIKQKIENVKGVQRLIYISLTNELIFGSDNSSPSLLQIWSPSSSFFTSKYKERQKIQIPSSSGIWSLCQINRNNDTKSRRIEFASGHHNGQIMIWSRQINESNHYSSIRTLKPFNDHCIRDLIFLNDKGLNCLIACCQKENKIVIYKGEEGEEEEEELEHEEARRLIPMSNGQFASGGWNQCLNIRSPSSSSSFSFSSSFTSSFSS